MPALLQMIHELAAYERAPDAVEATAEQLTDALFGHPATAHCHLGTLGGEVAGFALWFVNFSTWTGRPGMYLEDLFVRPSARGLGLGRALMATLAATAVERGYGRLDWAVLGWNTPAIGFYRALGARPLDEWVGYRLAGDALLALAAAGGPGGGPPASSRPGEQVASKSRPGRSAGPDGTRARSQEG